jgi:DNA polymerase-4/DNA polymerase V
MKEAVEADLGITVSVGVSLSKTLAKIGSKRDKPSGCVAISGRDIMGELRKLDVGAVWGIGPQTTEHCRRLGIRTAYDFASKQQWFIERHFTKPLQETWGELNGEQIFGIATGLKTTYASISKTKTFTPPSRERGFVWAQVMKNLENACIKARRHGLAARGISVFLKTQEFRYVGAEALLSRPTAFPLECSGAVRSLFEGLYGARIDYRATGVTLVDLVPAGTSQLSFFDSPVRIAKFERLYRALDDLSAKYGKHAVHLGASNAANRSSQHAQERGVIPERKLTRLRGESKRKHLRFPRLAGKVS